MNFGEYIAFIKKFFSLIPLGLFDYVVILTLALYVFEDASFGLLAAGTGFVSTISAFFIGLVLYRPLAEIIVDRFALTKGIADAIAFLFITLLSFFLISMILTFIRRRYISIFFPKNVDKIGGAIFGFLSFFFIASFAVALLLSFPIAAVVKDSIRNSISGKYLFSRTQGIEHSVRQIFGGAIDDTINFLTIKPQSNDTIELNFRTTSYTIDHASQGEMLALINKHRTDAGVIQVSLDDKVTNVALAHAKDMLERGYFSHYTKEGLSPFDRMAEAGVNYIFAGENLAAAPDVNIAMDGLMKSEGHRENILSKAFRKVGIGVLDAGIFGKIFVQEFTD